MGYKSTGVKNEAHAREIAENDGHFKKFREKHPNAKITVRLLEKVEIIRIASETPQLKSIKGIEDIVVVRFERGGIGIPETAAVYIDINTKKIVARF